MLERTKRILCASRPHSVKLDEFFMSVLTCVACVSLSVCFSIMYSTLYFLWEHLWPARIVLGAGEESQNRFGGIVSFDGSPNLWH